MNENLNPEELAAVDAVVDALEFVPKRYLEIISKSPRGWDQVKDRIFYKAIGNAKVIPKAEETEKEPYEVQVVKLVRSVGVPPHIKGYQYVIDSLLFIKADEENCKNGVTKILYPAVAKKYGTKASRVERAIRHAVELVFEKYGDPEYLYTIFKCPPNSGKTTNSEFLFSLHEVLKLQNLYT